MSNDIAANFTALLNKTGEHYKHERDYYSMPERDISEQEAFDRSLPRDVSHQDGRDFVIEAVDDRCVTISDGDRRARYRFYAGANLDMTKLRIKPAYIHSGWFFEAHAVTLTDGQGEAIFVPVVRR